MKKKKNKISSLISVVKSDIKTNWLLEKKGKNIFPVFTNNSQNSRRQNNNDYFLPNGGIYIAEIKNFKKNFFSNNTFFMKWIEKVQLILTQRKILTL